MSTYLRLLRLVFWMSPLQRWCTVLGLGMGTVGSVLLSPTEAGLDLMAFGQLLAFLLPALLGGAFWRALSAPRSVGLAPGGRARLLFAAAGVAATVAALCTIFFFLFYMDRSLPGHVTLALVRVDFVAAFSTATWWAIASFIASRSPLAMLIVLVLVVASVLALDRLGVEHIDLLWHYRWGPALSLALWAVFGAWFLKARHIAPPGWLLPGGQSLFASVATADTRAAGLAPAVAMQRLLLGGSSLPRILSQWLLAIGALLVLLLVVGRGSADQALIAAHVAFAALLLFPLIVAAQSAAIVRRARALWLPSGYSRRQLFAFTEHLLLKLAASMALLFCGLLLALWLTQPWHPVVTLSQTLCISFVPSLLLASYALLQVVRQGASQWPTMVLVVVLFVMVGSPLTNPDPASLGISHGWVSIALALATAVALRMFARHRWQTGDLPRATASPAAAI